MELGIEIKEGPGTGACYVVGYDMEQIQGESHVGCPVYRSGMQLFAVHTGEIQNQVTFLHHCNPQSCPLDLAHRCAVQKEGKTVTITKPAYLCNKAANRNYVLNAYSFYNEHVPNLDLIV